MNRILILIESRVSGWTANWTAKNMYTHVMECIGVKLRDGKNSGDVGLPGFSGEIGLVPLTPVTGVQIPLGTPFFIPRRLSRRGIIMYGLRAFCPRFSSPAKAGVLP